jgi:2',3'-cyclic-nucleotide 2'-phosphodiesterase/3'-nucleotidase
LILGTLNAARTATEATIVFSKNNATGRWTKQTFGKIISIEGYKPDSAFMAEFEPVIKKIKAYVAKPIGEFTSGISTHESFFGDSPFISLIHQVQLELTHADISFASLLSYNSEIKKGQVFVRDMFNLYKFENLLYTMNLSGQEIKDYLEFSYGQWYNQMKNPDDNLMNFKKDEHGELIVARGIPQLASAYYNFSSAAGINYTVDVSKPANRRINITSMANGKQFDLGKTYTVAINSYQGNGGGGLLTQGAKIQKDQITGRIINSTAKDLRFYLMKWIEEKKVVTPVSFNNWSVIPHEWWEKGKIKDSALMFR